MNYVGKSFLFDYGDFLVKVDYLSDARLKWEQMKGATPGAASEETYHSTEIRNEVSLISWQEKDASVVVQVLDWQGGRVYTTWISPDQSVHRFQGQIRNARS